MELLVLVVGAGVMAAVGIGVGMLMAPRLDRWAAPKPPVESRATEAAEPAAAPNERPDVDP